MKKNKISYFLVSITLILCLIININIVPTYSSNNYNYYSLFTTDSIGETENGSSHYDESTGTLTVIGSGTSIGKSVGNVDSYSFVNTELTGDFELTASLDNFSNLFAPKSKAGLIIRDDITSEDSNYFGIIMDTEHNSIRSHYRNYTISEMNSGSSNIFNNYNTIDSKIYLKISKVKNKFICMFSLDPEFTPENTFTKNKKITMNDDTVYLGFAVSNGLKSTSDATATFSNIKLSQDNTIIFDSSVSTEVTPLPPTEDNEDDIITPAPPVDDDNGVDIPSPPVDNDNEETTPTPPESNNLSPLLFAEDGSSLTKLISNSTLSASYSLSEETEALLIVALYDSNNKMINYKYCSSLNNLEDNKTLSLDFLLPEISEGYTVKAFVWDNLLNLTPLSDVTIVN